MTDPLRKARNMAVMIVSSHDTAHGAESQPLVPGQPGIGVVGGRRRAEGSVAAGLTERDQMGRDENATILGGAVH